MTQNRQEKERIKEMTALFVSLGEQEQEKAIRLLYSLQVKQLAETKKRTP